MPTKEWVAAEASGAQACDRIHSILRELRHKYNMERAELVAAVTEQVGDVRAEIEAVRDVTTECSVGLRAMQKQLAAMTHSHDGPADLVAATREATGKLAGVEDAIKRAAEEAQLLKSALLSDRIRREERFRRSEAEDAETDLRLRQVEETNAAVRAELHTVKSVNVETLQSVVDLVHECKYDAPTGHVVDDMRTLRSNVLAELQALREENAALTERVNTIVTYCEGKEVSRSSNFANLEQLVADLHARPKLPEVHMEYSVRPGRISGLMDTPRSVAPPSGQPRLRDRIAGFYASYNPSKLATLDQVLQEYEGADEELMGALELHYGALGYFSCH